MIIFLDRHLMKWSLIVLNINHREFPKECVASISSNKKINNHCRRKSTKKDIMAEYKKYNQWCKGEKKKEEYTNITRFNRMTTKNATSL